MSLVGYIWNTWGSVPSSPGKLARPLHVCLVKSHLGAFSFASLDWCWGTLLLHNSAQKYKCSALTFQFITYQLLICTNLSSTRSKFLPSDLLFFYLLLASLHGIGQMNSPGGISFMQPVLYTEAFCHPSQKWNSLILLKCLSLLWCSCWTTRRIWLLWAGLFKLWSLSSQSGWLRFCWDSTALPGIKTLLNKIYDIDLINLLSLPKLFWTSITKEC